MGFLEDAEKIAGAVVAVEGAKKLDPNASILTEGAAASSRIGIQELGMVESVKKFGPELN